MKLLLVEDNAQLAARIPHYVPEAFVVRTVHTGAEALASVRTCEYRMVVLDLGLPDMDGLEVCRSIRGAGHGMPILILTGSDDVPTRVKLLAAGADDYMSKPFDARELSARIDALARRPPLMPAEDMITIGDLTLDGASRTATRAGVRINLRRKEFDVLEYLVRNRGRIVTREMILNNVWEASATGWANTVDVHIKNLRDRVDRPFAVPIIKTVYGIGYRVEVPEGITAERKTRHD